MKLLFAAYLVCMVLNLGAAIDNNTAISYVQLSKSECQIFCEGEILQHVQMSKVLNGQGKLFDYKLKYSPASVLHNFTQILNGTLHPTNDTLKKFLSENFEPTDATEIWVPNDWHPVPSFASDIYDSNFRNWVLEMNTRWKDLGRKMNGNVLTHSELYSSIYVPHPFIVPGGIFNEYYYWDSYWIVEGLIISDMFQTAKYMISNLLYLVNKFGYVPNGGQKYYLGRSQPPFLIPMFDLYFKRTRSKIFLKESISTLEKEFDFWIKHRSKEIVHNDMNYLVFQYTSTIETPRPEQYFNDFTLGKNISVDLKGTFYSNVRAGAESGWDFSSRWFLKNGSRTMNLLDIDVNHIVPVCLNSLLGYNAQLLSTYFSVLGEEEKSKKYYDIAQSIGKTIGRLFWDDKKGIWLDYNLKSGRLLDGFYMSSLLPLWTETYGLEREPSYVVGRVINYIERHNISNYEGGMPTSLVDSHQQWDFPNGWAPLHHMVIFGLKKADKYDKRAGALSFKLAKKWIFNGFNTYLNSTPPSIYEKYDVVHAGNPGTGGEYVVQKGFGWTNGVAMKILSVYGHKIKMSDQSDPVSILVATLLLLTSAIAIANYLCRDSCEKGETISDTRCDFLLEEVNEDDMEI